MLVKILKMILYFFIIFAKPVYADDFDVTKDALNTNFYSTIAFSTNGYPTIKNILYEKSSFMAEVTDSVMMNGISSLTDMGYSRRIPNVADHVSVAPGTQVDVVYLYKNDTGHSINISSIDLVLSRNDKKLGDITQLLEFGDTSDSQLTYRYSGKTLTKTGIHKEYVVNKNIPSREENSFVLETVTVKNPINIESIKAVRDKDLNVVDIEIHIQNESNEYLNNVKLKYGEYEETFNIDAYNEYVSQFSISTEQDTLGRVEIYNPNIKEVCSNYGSAYYSYTNTDSVSVFTSRDGDLVPGATTQPVQEAFCVKRIPYTMTLDNVPITNKDESAEVLGVTSLKELPRTAKYNSKYIILLVVGGLLCYSGYILRRKYEGKNCNSRIRTKSGSNVR